MAKIKKYVGGLASAASGAGAAAMSNLTGGAASGGSSFGTKLDKFGAPILAATSTIANLINANKKQDPTGRPYKNGTNMIKYQNKKQDNKSKIIKYQDATKSLEADKERKVFSDTGSSFVITMDDLADSTLNAQAQGASTSSSNTGTGTKPSETGSKTSSKRGLSTGQQAGTAGAVGTLGGVLREYGKKGGSKTRTAAKYLGEMIKWLAPVGSAAASISANKDTKTGDIDYAGAIGQMFLDQAAGKLGKATVRIPYKTLKQSTQQSKAIQEDITKRGVTKEEYNAERKQHKTKENEAIAADKSIDEKNLIKYNIELAKHEKKMADRAKNKTRGQAPKPPVKPEPVTINQRKLAESDKPYLKYGPRIDITPTSEFAKQATMEEIPIPGFLRNYFKNRKAEKQYISETEAEKAKVIENARKLQIAQENIKKFRRLENTFGLDEKNFMGQLKKSGMSFEDFYQTKLDEFRIKGGEKTTKRAAKREKAARQETARQEQRFSPERREQARQNLFKKSTAQAIRFKESEQGRVAALKESFRENKPSLGYSMIERTRMPVEDITPTPRKSILLLPESPAAKRKATKAANTAARQATEQRVEGKVKKIKFYGTGNP